MPHYRLACLSSYHHFSKLYCYNVMYFSKFYFALGKYDPQEDKTILKT